MSVGFSCLHYRALYPTISFPTLFQKATDAIRRDALCAIVVFPRTKSVDRDEPQCTVEKDGIDYDQVLKTIETDVNIIALSARDDLRLVIASLQLVHEELHLDQFDGIQIYRSGLHLIRIRNTDRSTGRIVYVEINDYRRRLQSLLLPPFSGMKVYLVTTGILALSSWVMAIWSSRAWKWLTSRFSSATIE